MRKAKKKTLRADCPEKPTKEQWEKLYEVGNNLKKLAPWRVLRDTDILLLDLPDWEPCLYCSVMGHGDENYAIAVYPGQEAFWRLNRVLEHDMSTPPFLLMLEQDCLLCNFGDREEIEPQDREVMKALNLRFRGHNQWVYFRAATPGQFPWFLNADQAQLLIDALQNVFMLCLYYIEGKLEPDFAKGETMLRFYDEKTAQWFNTVVDMPPVLRPHYSMTLTDELMIARMKKQKKTKAVLELDWFYLPIPIQENKNVPPHGPHVTLVMDRESGTAIAQHMAQEGEPPLTVPPSMLVDYIMTYGRPSAIFTRSEEYASLLENTCKSVGVKLYWEKGMPLVDEYVESLMLEMSGFLGGQ